MTRPETLSTDRECTAFQWYQKWSRFGAHSEPRTTHHEAQRVREPISYLKSQKAFADVHLLPRRVGGHPPKG